METDIDTIQQKEVDRVLDEIDGILVKSSLNDTWIMSLCMYMAWQASRSLDKENTFLKNAETFLKATELVEREFYEMD